MSLNLALIGCGKMGGALLHNWLDNLAIAQILVVDPNPLPATLQNKKVKHFFDTESFNKSAQNIDALVLAVKPQIFDSVMADLKINPGTLLVSIAAGKKLASFSKDNPAIRVMPNTPAAIGAGISVAISNQKITQNHKDLAMALLTKTGAVEWIKDEEQLNAVTALSGSGPAYVFLLIETLTQAGIKQGLDPQFAERLARQTVIGSAALAAQDSKTSPSQLRQNVTSPGGTTEAALKILMNGELQKLYNEAITAATKRGQELSSASA